MRANWIEAETMRPGGNVREPTISLNIYFWYHQKIIWRCYSFLQRMLNIWSVAFLATRSTPAREWCLTLLHTTTREILVTWSQGRDVSLRVSEDSALWPTMLWLRGLSGLRCGHLLAPHIRLQDTFWASNGAAYSSISLSLQKLREHRTSAWVMNLRVYFSGLMFDHDRRFLPTFIVVSKTSSKWPCLHLSLRKTLGFAGMRQSKKICSKRESDWKETLQPGPMIFLYR